MEGNGLDIAIVLHYLTCKVALEDPEIGSTDTNILIDNNCMNDEFHCRIPRGFKDYNDEGVKLDVSDAIHNTSRRRLAATEL